MNQKEIEEMIRYEIDLHRDTATQKRREANKVAATNEEYQLMVEASRELDFVNLLQNLLIKILCKGNAE